MRYTVRRKKFLPGNYSEHRRMGRRRALCRNGGTYDKGLLPGEICLRIKNTSNMENFNLRAGRPVKIYLPMEQPEKMTAMYMFNPWWTRPAFIESFQEIPDRTQVLL